jgi:DNA-binding GntR family transcriptional regulator
VDLTYLSLPIIILLIIIIFFETLPGRTMRKKEHFPDIGNLSIRKVSMATEVASAVRQKILDGEVGPGFQIQEASLAAGAGVSRGTAREAIQILVREGLVRHNVHYGFTVTQLNDEDARDIYRIRRLLEIAGVQACANIDDEKAAELDVAVEKVRLAVEGGVSLEIISTDMLFHRRLVAFLGSTRLNDFYDALLSELRLGLALVDKEQDGSHLVAQHDEVASLLKAGRTAECVNRLLQHLDESEQLFRKAIAVRASHSAKEVPVSS